MSVFEICDFDDKELLLSSGYTLVFTYHAAMCHSSEDQSLFFHLNRSSLYFSVSFSSCSSRCFRLLPTYLCSLPFSYWAPSLTPWIPSYLSSPFSFPFFCFSFFLFHPIISFLPSYVLIKLILLLLSHPSAFFFRIMTRTIVLPVPQRRGPSLFSRRRTLIAG
jgi:hypothetical protein